MPITQVYNGDFSCIKDMMEGFGVSEETLQGSIILYAEYDLIGYEGQALVVLERNGEWFEVNCSHCSCDGLSWQEEPTTKAALASRPNVSDDLKKWLGIEHFQVIL
jgi:hypothetical protein